MVTRRALLLNRPRAPDSVSSIPVVKPRALEWPVADTSDAQSGPVTARGDACHVPGRLESHDEQRFHESQKLRRAPASTLKDEVTLKDAHLFDAVPAPEIIEELRFMIAVESTSHRLPVGFPDVEQPIVLGMQVPVKTEVGLPIGMPVIIELRPRHVDAQSGSHSLPA